MCSLEYIYQYIILYIIVHISIYYIIYYSTYYQYIFRLIQICSFHFIPCNGFAFLKIFSILQILGAHLRFFFEKGKRCFWLSTKQPFKPWAKRKSVGICKPTQINVSIKSPKNIDESSAKLSFFDNYLTKYITTFGKRFPKWNWNFYLISLWLLILFFSEKSVRWFFCIKIFVMKTERFVLTNICKFIDFFWLWCWF